MPSADPTNPSTGEPHDGLAPEIAALAGALDRLGVPAGWHALRTEDRLEARWSSASGSWARLSAGVGWPPPDADRRILVRSVVGSRQVWIGLAALRLDGETRDALVAVDASLGSLVTSEAERAGR